MNKTYNPTHDPGFLDENPDEHNLVLEPEDKSVKSVELLNHVFNMAAITAYSNNQLVSKELYITISQLHEIFTKAEPRSEGLIPTTQCRCGHLMHNHSWAMDRGGCTLCYCDDFYAPSPTKDEVEAEELADHVRRSNVTHHSINADGSCNMGCC
jgi:hypothetical protein